MTIFFYKQVQINSSDIRPHIKWAVSLVILHMVTSISLQGLCGYIWVNILTLSPQRVMKYFIRKVRSCYTPGVTRLHLRLPDYKLAVISQLHLASCEISQMLTN